MFEYIEANLKEINSRVARAAASVGRSADSVHIVAVSKTFPGYAIAAAVKAGITDIGENRVQEAEEKIKALGNMARWHMIGHLQSNKAKRAVTLFDMIQSVDSVRIAEAIDSAAHQLGKTVDCLIEVNSSAEESKTGTSPLETLKLVDFVVNLKNIRLCGLMTVGPLTDDPDRIRHAFRLTRRLFEEGKKIAAESFNTLSMGMSADYEVAIAEGATMIRVGTAIFGKRRKN